MKAKPIAVAVALSMGINSVASAQVLTNPQEIVLPSDYPTYSIRAGNEGITTFEVTLDQKAKATACNIVSSSGHSELDAETCRLVLERGRFELAPGQAKSRRAFRYTNRIRWILPKPSEALSPASAPVVQVYQGGRPCALPTACFGDPDAYRLDLAYSSPATTSAQKQMIEYIILQNTTSTRTDWSLAARTYFSWREAVTAKRSEPVLSPAAPVQTTRPYSSLTKNTLCRDMKKARKSGAGSYPAYLAELSNRGLTEQNCAVQWGKILLGVAAVGLVAAAANSSGNTAAQSSSFYGTKPTVDFSYSWDEQASAYEGRQWVCRGEQTGQYAPLWQCANKIKVDTRWPG